MIATNIKKNFKEVIYDRYVSVHNSHLYGGKTKQDYLKNFPNYSQLYKRFIPDNKSVFILDIGCGDGNLVMWLQSMGYHNSFGFDISGEQISLGEKMEIKNLSILDIMALDSGQGKKYDIIFARDVFEHFTRQDFFECLQVLKNLLAANGKIIIQVPNGEGIHVSSILYGDVTHEMAYTQSSLRQLALAVGFRGVDVFPINPYAHGIMSTIRSVLWRLKVLQLSFWRYVERGNASGVYTANIIAVIS